MTTTDKIDPAAKYDKGDRILQKEDVAYLRSTIKEIYDSSIPYQVMYEATTKICEMFIDNQISFKTATQIFKNQSPENPEQIQTILTTTYDNYNFLMGKNNPSPSLKVILTATSSGSPMETNDAQRINKEILDKIKYNPYKRMVISNIGKGDQYINENINKIIILQTNTSHNSVEVTTDTYVLGVCIKEVTQYTNPLDDDVTLYKVTFEIDDGKMGTLTLGPSTIPEIYERLHEEGEIINYTHAKQALSRIIKQFVKEGIATVKNEIEYPGFFIDKETGEIITVKYEITNPNTEELKNALKQIEQFAEHYKEKIKVAHILKWGLISPFSYAIKQKGKWINHLYLYGKAGSGKTTLADMILYLWNIPDNDTNDIGGSSFNTEARIGERLKKFTFPIVVNEPQGTFEKPGIVEMIKSSIERTNSRGKFHGRNYKTIPSLSPVIYTSNHTLPTDDALIRRMDCISFTHNERKTPQEKETFIQTFNTENREECILHQLKPLAHYFAQEIITNPTLLNIHWRELTNTLITQAYHETNQKTPPWLLQWSKTETLEDIDDLIIERIRIFLQTEINKAHGQIQIIDEDGRPQRNYKNEVETKTTDDFRHRVWNVLNERKIPYIYLTKQENIQLTRGFNDSLKKETQINESLRSIAELLNWKYGLQRLGGPGKHTKVISTTFETFLEFIFP